MSLNYLELKKDDIIFNDITSSVPQCQILVEFTIYLTHIMLWFQIYKKVKEICLRQKKLKEAFLIATKMKLLQSFMFL